MAKHKHGSGWPGHKPPEGEAWAWIPRSVLGSLLFRALSVTARRILDFALHEHCSNGGAENGNLAIPYSQLTGWGVTPADAARGLEELIVAGFLRKTFQGRRTEGGPASRFAITWFSEGRWRPLRNRDEGAPASNEWMAVAAKLQAERIGTVKAVRAWLKAETAQKKRGAHAARRRLQPIK